MELYYEIEGLRPAPYTVELAVRKKGVGGGIFKKIFGGGGAAIKLKFEQQATTARSRPIGASSSTGSSPATTCWSCWWWMRTDGRTCEPRSSRWSKEQKRKGKRVSGSVRQETLRAEPEGLRRVRSLTPPTLHRFPPTSATPPVGSGVRISSG